MYASRIIQHRVRRKDILHRRRLLTIGAAGLTIGRLGTSLPPEESTDDTNARPPVREPDDAGIDDTDVGLDGARSSEYST